ncbi:MAG: hypothetical protein ACTSWA_09000 [Candidatus Thorarchaeota archaeon]
MVSSTLAKGRHQKKGIQIESKWKLNRDRQTITFMSSFLITRFSKEPLMPSEIPDRHLRSIRELGAKVFKIKPFRGLKLYAPLVENTITLAERKRISNGKEAGVPDREVRVFVNNQDAELWKLQRDSTSLSTRAVLPQNIKGLYKSERTVPQVIRSAQKNSLSMRYECVQLIEQVITGLAAIKRILVLKERGLDQGMLDYIWGSVFGKSESPLKADSITTKVKEILAK